MWWQNKILRGGILHNCILNDINRLVGFEFREGLRVQSIRKKSAVPVVVLPVSVLANVVLPRLPDLRLRV
jgi:hypothetical protein